MENEKLLVKLSRILPSSAFNSCHSRTLLDVADGSIVITKTNKIYSDTEGPKCPPVTPSGAIKKHSSSSNSGRWFTSSDVFETDTFYSLSSNSGRRFRGRCSFSSSGCGDGEQDRLGSDQSETQIYYRSSCRRRRTTKGRRKNRGRPSFSIEEGLAVEKRSSDPYSDFMSSMAEMIIKKQMFGAEDLDRLLFCFLSLNKEDYHGVIFQVFAEICQTLFSN
ncbi:hypothetical protein CASFOL_000049 [Castilleja foliolosa]|uniref:Transcription repressor n=1 Tax=Castilleja foliolosa TaxID=1961234 RepID=A0ABD3EMU3_9LAMI